MNWSIDLELFQCKLVAIMTKQIIRLRRWKWPVCMGQLWNWRNIAIYGHGVGGKLKTGLPANTALLWHASQDFTTERITSRKFWRKSVIKIAQYAPNCGCIFSSVENVHFALEKRRLRSTKPCVRCMSFCFLAGTLAIFNRRLCFFFSFKCRIKGKREEHRSTKSSDRNNLCTENGSFLHSQRWRFCFP